MLSDVDKKRKLIFALFIAIVGCVYFVFNEWTPMRADDYFVPLTFERNADGQLVYSTHRISSVAEWIQAWYHHWCVFMHGRISDHLGAVVMIIFGKHAVSALNTIVFLLVLAGICRFSFRTISLPHYSLALFSCLLMLPCVWGTLLWPAGAYNYLWGGFLLIWVLLIVRKCTEGSFLSLGMMSIGLIAGFLSGALHEALGATLSFALLMFGGCEMLRKHQLPRFYWMMLASVVAGTLIPMSSPAMWHRSGVEDNDVSSLIRMVALSCMQLTYFSGIPLVVAGVMAWRKPGSLISPICFLVIANLPVVMLFGSKGGWGGAYFYLNIALILYVLQQARGVVCRFPRYVAVVSCVGSSLIAIVAAPQGYAIHRIYEKVLSEAGPNEHITIDVSEFGDELPFMMSMILPQVDIQDKQLLQRSVCAWYAKEPFTVYYRHCCMNPESYKVFEHDSPHQIVTREVGNRCVVRLPKGAVPTGSAIFIMRGDKQELKLYAPSPWLVKQRQRVMSYLRGHKYGYIEKDYQEGYFYLILPPSSKVGDSIQMTIKQNGEEVQVEAAMPNT